LFSKGGSSLTDSQTSVGNMRFSFMRDRERASAHTLPSRALREESRNHYTDKIDEEMPNHVR
jgi:hypothetical protein